MRARSRGNQPRSRSEETVRKPARLRTVRTMSVARRSVLVARCSWSCSRCSASALRARRLAHACGVGRGARGDGHGAVGVARALVARQTSPRRSPPVERRRRCWSRLPLHCSRRSPMPARVTVRPTERCSCGSRSCRAASTRHRVFRQARTPRIYAATCIARTGSVYCRDAKT